MTKRELGERIRTRRKVLKMTLETMSHYTDISMNTLSAIERGEANPSFEVLSEIFRYLGLEMTVDVKRK